MVVKVYGPVRAACPQRVMVCLLELGVEFEVVPVDLQAGEQKQPHILARQVRNPYCLTILYKFTNIQLGV